MASLATSLSWEGWRCGTRSKASAAPHRGQTLDPSRIYKPQAFWGKALSDRTFNTHTHPHTCPWRLRAGQPQATLLTGRPPLGTTAPPSPPGTWLFTLQAPGQGAARCADGSNPLSVGGSLPSSSSTESALWDPVNLHAYHPHQTALHKWSSPRAEPQYLWHISHRKPLQQEE